MAGVPFTTQATKLLMKETGGMINFMDMEHCIMNKLVNYMGRSIIKIGKMLNNTGLNIKVNSTWTTKKEKENGSYQMERFLRDILNKIWFKGREF